MSEADRPHWRRATIVCPRARSRALLRVGAYPEALARGPTETDHASARPALSALCGGVRSRFPPTALEIRAAIDRRRRPIDGRRHRTRDAPQPARVVGRGPGPRSARPTLARDAPDAQPIRPSWPAARVESLARTTLAVGAVRQACADPRPRLVATRRPGAGVSQGGVLRLAWRHDAGNDHCRLARAGILARAAAHRPTTALVARRFGQQAAAGHFDTVFGYLPPGVYQGRLTAHNRGRDGRPKGSGVFFDW